MNAQQTQQEMDDLVNHERYPNLLFFLLEDPRSDDNESRPRGIFALGYLRSCPNKDLRIKVLGSEHLSLGGLNLRKYTQAYQPESDLENKGTLVYHHGRQILRPVSDDSADDTV